MAAAVILEIIGVEKATTIEISKKTGIAIRKVRYYLGKLETAGKIQSVPNFNDLRSHYWVIK